MNDVVRGQDAPEYCWTPDTHERLKIVGFDEGFVDTEPNRQLRGSHWMPPSWTSPADRYSSYPITGVVFDYTGMTDSAISEFRSEYGLYDKRLTTPSITHGVGNLLRSVCCCLGQDIQVAASMLPIEEDEERVIVNLAVRPLTSVSSPLDWGMIWVNGITFSATYQDMIEKLHQVLEVTTHSGSGVFMELGWPVRAYYDARAMLTNTNDSIWGMAECFEKYTPVKNRGFHFEAVDPKLVHDVVVECLDLVEKAYHNHFVDDLYADHIAEINDQMKASFRGENDGPCEKERPSQGD